jgi:hypothetical protein
VIGPGDSKKSAFPEGTGVMNLALAGHNRHCLQPLAVFYGFC